MQTRNFSSDILTFYIKGKVSQPNPDLIELEVPNTILGILPLGKKTVTVPVSHIASVGTNTGLNFKHLFIFLIAFLISLYCMLSSVKHGEMLAGLWSLLCGCVCFCGMLNAFWVMLAIRNTSGEVIGYDAKNGYADGIRFVIFEKSKAIAVAKEINELVAQRNSDTNFRTHAEANTQAVRESSAAIVDAIKSSKQ